MEKEALIIKQNRDVLSLDKVESEAQSTILIVTFVSDRRGLSQRHYHTHDIETYVVNGEILRCTKMFGGQKDLKAKFKKDLKPLSSNALIVLFNTLELNKDKFEKVNFALDAISDEYETRSVGDRNQGDAPVAIYLTDAYRWRTKLLHSERISIVDISINDLLDMRSPYHRENTEKVMKLPSELKHELEQHMIGWDSIQSRNSRGRELN